MLHTLELENVGPTPLVELTFAERLNIFTGDNGLGKSFFLDTIWWAMTRKWVKQINPSILSGDLARPRAAGKARISFEIADKANQVLRYESSFERKSQSWQGASARPMPAGLIIYAMADGSIAIWDCMRNYWKTVKQIDEQDTPPAYVFSAQQLWYGLPSADGQGSYCRGLIEDWVKWQELGSEEWHMLEEVLHTLSPHKDELLKSGALTQMDVTKVDEMPTLIMPYGSEVPIIHTSAGIRRILGLAYAIVWAWQSHIRAARLLDEPITPQITLLIDEVESHLHPQWQRRIVRALMHVMEKIHHQARLQVFLTTHSPLVMLSCEDYYDRQQDAWFDIDCTHGAISIENRQLMKQGDANAWLESEAFDLKSARSEQSESLIREAETLRSNPKATLTQLRSMSNRLALQLGETSDFYFMWKFYVSQIEQR